MIKNALTSLLLAATAVGTALGATGCMVEARGHVSAPMAVVEVDEEPPPPRVETVEFRPGFVRIEGRYVRNGNRWAWRDGYYERERVGYAWDQGRWETRGNHHVWVEGRWRSGGPERREERREEVRDHREREGGAVVRDHR
jgi:hypothetical protein